jgi:hypothetical protein
MRSTRWPKLKKIIANQNEELEQLRQLVTHLTFAGAVLAQSDASAGTWPVRPVLPRSPTPGTARSLTRHVIQTGL